MTIRKRGTRHTVEIYDPAVASKKRYIGTYDTRSEARAAGRQAETEVAQRRGRRRTHTETIGGYYARWLQLHPRTKPSTNDAYREQVKSLADEHGTMRLADVDVEFALEWVGVHRWTLGGIRAMFSDARRSGLINTNPWCGLRLRGSRGRKDIDILTSTEVTTLADCATEVWDGHVAQMVRTLVLFAGFVGMRPAELYGLRWSDIDLAARDIEGRVVGAAIHVRRQYLAKQKTFDLPKNGHAREIVLTPPAKTALLAMPRPLDSDALVFRASRGGPMTGRVQHYYWHPVRVRFGRPSMDFYELRHFCGSWLFNDLELPAQDVAHQLGHTDGGALVQKLYGHPSDRLARDRIRRATAAAEIADLSVRQADGRDDGEAIGLAGVSAG